jgi:hypothetical protein
MLNLGYGNPNKNLHIVYSIKWLLQVINLVLIATGFFDLKGTPLFDFHFMSIFQSLYYLSHGSI